MSQSVIMYLQVGELGAIVMIDAISRFVPGVLSNEESSQFESLQDNLLEYPHYTRPEVWHDKSPRGFTVRGITERIEGWRHEQSILRTKERRPISWRKLSGAYSAACRRWRRLLSLP